MPNHIAQARTKDDLPKNILKDVVFFDSDGNAFKEDFKKDEKNNFVSEQDYLRYAKIESYTNGEIRHFIKLYRGGRIGETVVDPASILGSERDLRGYNDKFGERFAEYRRVNQVTFETYTNYLISKYPPLFKNVERRVLDGESE